MLVKKGQYGLPETKNEDANEVVISLCPSKLGIDIRKEDINICHKLAHKGKYGNRPMIVRFCRGFIKKPSV